MRNHEVTKVQPLLNADGTLREPGWSRKLCQVYDRNAIKAPKFRIKEWDYYLIISDDGYIGLQSATLLDFSIPWEHTETILNAFPMGKFKLPTTSERGDTVYHDKRLDMEFRVSEGKRRLLCNFKKFHEGKTFSCDITLEQPEMDTMVIATPWKEKATAFYYNQKINCMRASGKATFDGKEYIFDPATDFGTLDWGRGVWTYDNTWYWGSGNGTVNGKRFGYNIGYGFGDTTAASENMIFYDGKCHKLDRIRFEIPEDIMQPWKYISSDGRFDMDFKPLYDNRTNLNALVIAQDAHQVFGKLSGKAVLDDGTALEIKDLTVFAERVRNRY